MIVYFLVLFVYSEGGGTVIPVQYENLKACQQAGEVSKGQYGRGMTVVCVPWNSEGD